MAKSNIPDTTNGLGAVWGHHLLQVCQESLVDREQVIDVAEHGLGLIRRQYGGASTPREVSERIRVVILQDLEPFHVGTLCRH